MTTETEYIEAAKANGIELWRIGAPLTTGVQRCQLHVDGCGVPYVEAYELPDGTFSLSIVRPGGSPLLGMDVTSEEEILEWAPFLANAMAVAAGRTSHGPNSRPHNPHGANWFFEDDRSPVGTPGN